MTCSYSPSTRNVEDFPLQIRKLGVSNATGISPRARPSAAHAYLAYSLRRGNGPRPHRLLGAHHTYEQRLAALSQLSFLPSGFPRTPVASPTDTTSCLAATPWVRGVSATTRAYRPPTGLGHPAPGHTSRCARSPALRQTNRLITV